MVLNKMNHVCENVCGLIKFLDPSVINNFYAPSRPQYGPKIL